MPEALSITKPNTVETFMKANTDLRIAADALKEFQNQLDTLARSITKEAAKQATAADRTTIMAVDVKTAMTAVTGSTSELPYLFRQLEKLTAKETADLSTLIQNWITAHTGDSYTPETPHSHEHTKNRPEWPVFGVNDYPDFVR